MSGREPQDQESKGAYGYATTHSSQAPTYAGYAPPAFAQQLSSSHPGDSHALSSTHQMPFLEPRDTTYQGGSDSLSVAHSRFPPSPLTRLELTSKGPYYGRAGDTLRIDFRSRTDFTTQDFRFSLSFSQYRCKATCTRNWTRDIWHFYTLSVTIPSVNSLDQHSTMPLLLDVRSANGDYIDLQNLDTFSYLDNSDFGQLSLPQAGKKRKVDDDVGGFTQPLSKRTVSQPIHRLASATDAPSVQAPLSLASPFSAPPPLFALPSGYERSGSQIRTFDHTVPPSPQYAYGPSPTVAPQKVRSPHSAPLSAYATLRGPLASPRLARTPRAASAQVMRSPTQPSNPQLIRTSVLEQVQSSGARGFNPYAQYPTGKASLRIDGDLMGMTRDWSADELEAKRRLVEFSRVQSGSQVTTSFKAVSPEERTPNSACISCIYWEETKNFFVTSVDTIALLESLIAARFTVEEKNRIRRNLEGFKPMTVSKLKEDTDSFFRLIMGFPNPKPRNIEKDVKVFPWSRLEEALSKIFGKYSASSASTASHIFHPVVTSGAGPAQQLSTHSPPGLMRPTASSSGMYSLTPTSVSPPMTAMGGPAVRPMMHQLPDTPSFLHSLPMTVQEAQQQLPGQASSMVPLTPGSSNLAWQSQYLQASRYPMGMPLSYLGQSMAPSPALYARPLSYYPGDEAIEASGAKSVGSAYQPHSQPTTSC